MSWFEATARERIDALADAGSFQEFLGPERHEISPHLGLFDLPVQFDDGIVVGRAELAGRTILLAAQEGRFMGGAFGEVHGAKLTGLLRAALALRRPVLILFDTGGVRPQEANAGGVAVSEIIRALIEARLSGVSVIGLIGGRAGCYGGGGIIAGCCTQLIMSEQGRIGVSSPDVIETNCGVEDFNFRDHALVCRTMGGKHRFLLGGADQMVDDDGAAFRAAAASALGAAVPLSQAVLGAEQKRLKRRLAQYGTAKDSRDIWHAMGITPPDAIPELPLETFLDHASGKREQSDDAR